MSTELEDSCSAIRVHDLADEDISGIAAAARRLVSRGSTAVDEPAWVRAASVESEELPASTRTLMKEFRRDSGRGGALLVRGFPIDRAELPETPQKDGSVQRHPTLPAAYLLMAACMLGNPGAYRAEKSGALVQDVVPVPGREDFQGNAGSVELFFHNENAFHPHRPDFVMLLCLRPDHEAEAGLRTSCIRAALPLLAQEARQALSSHEFATERPSSFGSGESPATVHAVLTGAPDDPDVRVDFAVTRGLSSRAEKSLRDLSEAVESVACTVQLRPGDLAIVDNRVTLHGRTRFSPRYDGLDRWLQRSFVFIDIRRSREYRVGDGYILS